MAGTMNPTSVSLCHLTLRHLLSQYLPRCLERGAYTDRLFCQTILESPVPDEEIIREAREQVIDRLYSQVSHFEHGPFHHLPYALAKATGSAAWWERFRELALRTLEVPCTPEGAWMHPRGKFGSGCAVLLDSFQEEAVCLLLYADSIRPEDSDKADRLEDKAVEQFHLHREILRNPDTGLWHNGRGWISSDPKALSPGAWSRGHGWLLRGCVAACAALEGRPRGSEVEDLLLELVETLLPLRNSDGAWPVLLNRVGEGSPSETSGSAMMAASILKARRIGLNVGNTAVKAACNCLDFLMDQRVDPEGLVVDACAGPGPLMDESRYRESFPREDSHGAFSMLEACMERLASCSDFPSRLPESGGSPCVHP